MDSRYEAIGIKQTLRLEWMQKTTHLLLAGLGESTIRQELHASLIDESKGKKSAMSRRFAVGNLMNTWVCPTDELIPLRDAALAFLRESPAMAIAIHWSMISAAYPFWFSAARQTGRLLALQGKITQAQIVRRLKEHYGDRPTVSRCARHVIRSFVAWGVLKDSTPKGCYEKTPPLHITNPALVILMLEAAMLTTKDARGDLGLLMHSPALFPFQLPALSADALLPYSNNLEVLHYGQGEALLQWKRKFAYMPPA